MCEVLDPVGLPMQRAEVALIGADGRPVARGTSDPYGQYQATVPPGDYQLAVTADGFQPHRSPVRIDESGCAAAGPIRLDVAPPSPLPGPGRWDIDPAHTAIRFIARHIGLGDVHGRFNAFQGAIWVGDPLATSQLEVVIEAASIDTGVRMRDDHLRSPDFLDVDHYPTLRFTGDRFTHRGGSRWSVAGVLDLHGVARTVRLDAVYLGKGTGMEGEARAACRAGTELHREDFTLNWRKMLAAGIAVVGPTIRVELDIQAVKSS
ncbi:YceI family protein [Streptomyces sp. 6N223]|uniref:YceI family protein n=1 Tax=Streptomyces sp. 6N223 TaxID=3457412 RepID=UPI003FD653BC